MNSPTEPRDSTPASLAHLASVCSARRNIYHFLASALIAPPGQEMVVNLMTNGPSTCLAALFPSLQGLAIVGAEEIELEAAKAKEDFDALFVVPTGRYLKPFESVYAEPGRQGLLMGPPARAALRAYAQAGADLAKRRGLLPDHIGVEISFMDFLCSQEDRAWNNANETQARAILSVQASFISSHLNGWVPELADLMEQNAEGGLYKAVSRLLKGVVHADLVTLSFLLLEACDAYKKVRRPGYC